MGLLRSFGGLCLPAEFDRPRLETHAIINYFARLGTMLGYVPRCEKKWRDLEWVDTESKKVVLHLESENAYVNAIPTLTGKLAGSDADLRIGYFWTKEQDVKELEEQLAGLARSGKGNYLVIAKVSPVRRAPRGGPWEYEVRGWHIMRPARKPHCLPKATLVWPREKPGGSLYVRFGC